MSTALIESAQQKKWSEVSEIMRKTPTDLSMVPEQYAVGFALLKASMQAKWGVAGIICRNSCKFNKWADLDSIKLAIQDAIYADEAGIVDDYFTYFICYMKYFYNGKIPLIAEVASNTLELAAALNRWRISYVIFDLQNKYKFKLTTNSITSTLEKAAQQGIKNVVERLFAFEQNANEVYAHPECLKRALLYAEESGHIDFFNCLNQKSQQRKGIPQPPTAYNVYDAARVLRVRRSRPSTPNFFDNHAEQQLVRQEVQQDDANDVLEMDPIEISF